MRPCVFKVVVLMINRARRVNIEHNHQRRVATHQGGEHSLFHLKRISISKDHCIVPFEYSKRCEHWNEFGTNTLFSKKSNVLAFDVLGLPKLTV